MLLFVPFAYCPVTGHHREVWPCHLYSGQILIYTHEPSLLQAEQSQSSQPVNTLLVLGNTKPDPNFSHQLVGEKGSPDPSAF